MFDQHFRDGAGCWYSHCAQDRCRWKAVDTVVAVRLRDLSLLPSALVVENILEVVVVDEEDEDARMDATTQNLVCALDVRIGDALEEDDGLA